MRLQCNYGGNYGSHSLLFRLILEESQVNRRCEAMNVAVVRMQSASYPDSNSAWI